MGVLRFADAQRAPPSEVLGEQEAGRRVAIDQFEDTIVAAAAQRVKQGPESARPEDRGTREPGIVLNDPPATGAHDEVDLGLRRRPAQGIHRRERDHQIADPLRPDDQDAAERSRIDRTERPPLSQKRRQKMHRSAPPAPPAPSGSYSRVHITPFEGFWPSIVSIAPGYRVRAHDSTGLRSSAVCGAYCSR